MRVDGPFILCVVAGVLLAVTLILVLVVNGNREVLPIRPGYAANIITGNSLLGIALDSTRDLVVGFLGDTGARKYFRDALRLIKLEGADLVLQQGDLGYGSGPWLWNRAIDDILGPAFPYVAVAGNHDAPRWNEYRTLIRRRLLRSGLAAGCSGMPGENLACSYRGFAWYQSDIGVFHDVYVNWTLPTELFARAAWRACSWHKNAHLLQVGAKRLEVPYSAYRACTQAGAFIFNGHTHTYSRSHLLADLRNRHHITLVDTESPYQMAPNRSIVIVNGLGGMKTRNCHHGLADKPWWASVLCRNRGFRSGSAVSFCRFYGHGQNATCYLKNAQDGSLLDTFDVLR